MRGEFTARRRGGLGGLAHPRREELRDEQGQERDRDERRHRGGEEPLPEVDLEPGLLDDLHGDRVGGRGRHPQRGGDREARHRAEHEVAAQAPGLGILGLRARPLGDGEHDRVEHSAARRVAREGRRDGRVGEHDAVGEAERRAAEAADHEEADALAEARLHHGLRDDEGDHHQQHARVGEARVGLLRFDRPGHDDGAHGQHRGREQREGADQHRRDGRGEDGEQVPGGRREPGRNGEEPDAERDRERRRALQAQSRAHRGDRPAAGPG